MIRYLILVLALLLVAIRPAPAQQGNLPKPVQSLPAYPPVRCVTVDWTVESCEWRQVQAAVSHVDGPNRVQLVEEGGCRVTRNNMSLPGRWRW
jgi:hypothetical protein